MVEARPAILVVSARLLGGRSTVGLRALDADIGVRIPASQPITPKHPKSFHRSGLPGSIPAAPYARPAGQSGACRRNMHAFNGLARIKRVRIPRGVEHPEAVVVGFGALHACSGS